MINTIISKAPSANSEYIYKQIEKNLEDKVKSFLIVPEQYTLQTDMRLIEAIDRGTVMDAKVLSFSSLARFILDRTGDAGVDSLSKSGKIMVITNILRDLNDRLTLFKNAYQNPDFVKDIEAFVSSIKDNNFDDEFFNKLIKGLGEGPMALKFEEIKIIFEAYQEEISGKFIDTEDRMALVIDKLDQADFLKGSKFYFDKFDYVSDIKMDFIKKLDQKGIEVTIGLTLDRAFIKDPRSKDVEIYEMAEKFYQRLRDRAAIKEIILDAPINPHEDLAHLCMNFEKYLPKKYQANPKNIHILESTTTLNEITNVGLFIKRLTKEKEVRYKDISIYLSNSDEYENEIKRVFASYQIPIFLSRTNKLTDNHIVKTYLAILRLLAYGFSENDLTYFLRSGIFDFGENTNEKVISLQNFIKARNIKYSMFLEDKYFVMDQDFYKNYYKNDPRGESKLEEKTKDFARVNEIREQVLDLLGELLELRDKKVKISILIRALYKMMSHPGFIRGINAYQAILKAENDLDSFEENNQVWDKLMTILEQLDSLMGDREDDLKGLYTLIRSCANDIEIGIIPPSKDHVIISNFTSPRIANRPINFALGLNDAFFPSKAKKDPILGKQEIDKIKDMDIDLKVYDQDSEEKEKLNLYKLVQTSDKVYLSFALADKEGAGINKSSTLKGILNIFPHIKIRDLTSLAMADLLYAKDLAQAYALDKVKEVQRGETISKKEALFSKTYLTYLKNYGPYDLIFQGLFHTNDKLGISRQSARGLYGKNHFNITEIETYARCPYRYFVTYGLSPAYDQSYDVDARELGTIVHNSLEDVTRTLISEEAKDQDYEDLEKKIKEDFEISISNILDRARRNDPRNLFIIQNIIKNTQANSRQIINQLKQGEFKVADVEVDFGYGKDGDYPPVFVDSENYLRGRIDRIDKTDEFIRIIDYKTGSKVFKIVNILNGLDLQLLVYMISAAAKDDGLEPIGSFYMPLADELQKLDQTYEAKTLEQIYEDKFKMNGLLVKINEQVFKLIDKDFSDMKDIAVIDKKNTDILSIEENKIIEKFVKNLVKTYIHEIKAGSIKLNPLRYSDTVNECQFCDYKGICKFDESIDFDKYRDFDKTKSIDDLKEKGEDNG